METNQLKKSKDLLKEAQELLSIAIAKDTISAIERDLILEKLRKAYDSLIFDQRSEKQFITHPTTQTPKVVVEKVPEIHVKPTTPEIKPQVRVESKQQEKIIEKDTPTKKPDKTEISTTLDSKDGKISSQSIRDKQHTETLGDKYQGTKKFRNEALSSQNLKKDISTKLQGKPIVDLTKAIGVNDKFHFIKELFNGNSDTYNKTIATLNQFSDITDAMIYIHENFHWADDNEAANKFIELVRRKLLN